MEKKKILIVEDDDALASDIQAKLIRDDREFRSVDNKEDAIQALRLFSPNIVLLDLGIFESKTKKAVAPPINGSEVAKEIDRLNSNRQGIAIQIIFVTASLEHEFAKSLIDQGLYVHGRVEKGSDDFYESLCGAVDAAEKYPRTREIIIPYKGLSFEILNNLKQVNFSLFEMLERYILKSFESEHYFECIVRCGIFAKCLYDEFTLNQKIYDLKSLFNNKLPKRDENAKSWVEKWDEIVKKGIIREIDRNFAVSVILARNVSAHDGDHVSAPQKYTIDDAATTIQLLVPLINKYIEKKKGSE